MAESSMRDELLRQGGLSTLHPRARQDAQDAVRKARRWTRRLAAATIVLWLLAAGAIVACLVGFVTFFLPWIAHWGGKVAELTVTTSAPVTSLDARWMQGTEQSIGIIALYLLYGGIVVAAFVALAAGSTVAFVYASRQATLKQIQLSLDEIVEQLKNESKG